MTEMLSPKDSKILVIGDSSTKKTGFAVAKRQLLDLLWSEGYNIAEFGFAGAQRNKQLVPWKYYPVVPTDRNSEEYAAYGRNPKHKQGGGRWHDLCLHYKPNLVIMFCDPWDVDTMVFSPLSDFYKTVLYVPLDSGPVNAHLTSVHHAADYVIPFTHFAKDELAKVGIETLEPIAPGFNQVHTDKAACRRALGIPVEAEVFGWVGRNQPRKRILELINAFERYLASTNRDSYLFLHTGLVDVSSWDLPSLLVNSDYAHRILFSYKEKDTQNIIARPFQHVRIHANEKIYNACNAESTVIESMATIYGAMDCYVQAANCEGFGIPIAEAAAHGTPNICVDHTAMAEVCRNTKGLPVRPASLLYEPIISTLRASIDQEAMVEAMKNRPTTVEHYYTMEKFEKDWLKFINEAELENLWDQPQRRFDQNHPYELMSTASFAACGNIHPYVSLQILQDSYIHDRKSEEITNRVRDAEGKLKHMEAIRLGLVPLEEKDWMKD